MPIPLLLTTWTPILGIGIAADSTGIGVNALALLEAGGANNSAGNSTIFGFGAAAEGEG